MTTLIAIRAREEDNVVREIDSHDGGDCLDSKISEEMVNNSEGRLVVLVSCIRNQQYNDIINHMGSLAGCQACYVG